MSADKETISVEAQVANQAALTSLQQLQAAAEKLQKTLAGLRIPAASVSEQQAWNAERQSHAREMAGVRTGERGGTVIEAIDKRQGVASTVQSTEETRQATERLRGQRQAANSTAAAARIEAGVSAFRSKAGIRVRNAKELNEARRQDRLDAEASLTAKETAKTEGAAARSANVTEEQQKRLQQRADAKNAEREIADARRKEREAEQAQRVADNKSQRGNAGLLQAFALGGPAGAGRHMLGQQMQNASQWVMGTGARAAATNAANAAYQQQLFAWQTNLGGGPRGPMPPAPPGTSSLGGAGKWAAGGAAAAALIGAGSLMVGYNQISDRVGTYRGWERGLRGSAGMGNYRDVREIRTDALAAQATAMGIGHEEYMPAKAEYLRARGRNRPFTEQENLELLAGINQGVAPSTVGRWNTLQMHGAGLIGKGRGMSDAMYGLNQAGLTEDAMRTSLQSMLGYGEQAASRGGNYDWTQHVGMTKGLNRMFGDPTRAHSMTEGIAGAGRGALSGLEAAMTQISDMSVLAGFAGETGNAFDLMDKLKTGSPTERMRQMQKVGPLAFKSMGSYGEALKLAGASAGSFEAELDKAPKGYMTHEGQFSRIAAQGERARDTMAMEGNTAEEVAKLHETLKGLTMAFGTMLPNMIQENVYAALRMAGGGGSF